MIKKNDFTSSISVNLDSEEVIKRINNIPGWWGVSFSGDTEKQNGQFVVKMSGDSFFDFTVKELTPGRRIVWLVTDCFMPWFDDKKEWANNILIFDLSEINGVTTVNFEHKGLTPNVDCYKDCVLGWTHWIQTSLFSYLTTGKGVFRPPTK